MRKPRPRSDRAGSLHDDEVIAAAEGTGAAMVLTGIRHLRHGTFGIAQPNLAPGRQVWGLWNKIDLYTLIM